ncbi:MAG: cob(I)yrinic acid a,c-diamide adenosyltransferase [Actinobacteria bacterium]|nr:cob(I)yrinic acid a,c-diamide adenosyltransferase [Actinomycetota bacterium]
MDDNRENKGLVLINTGNGKGKTTAALGCALRTAGHKQKVLILQYIKGTMNTGELKSLECLRPFVEIEQLGEGFIKYRDGKPVITDEYRQKTSAAIDYSLKKIKNSDYNLIILDEIINLLNFNLITFNEIKELINNRPEGASIILTGSNAPEELIEMADTVTEMKEIKHAFRDGICAKKGLEY